MHEWLHGLRVRRCARLQGSDMPNGSMVYSLPIPIIAMEMRVMVLFCCVQKMTTGYGNSPAVHLADLMIERGY